MGGDRGVGMWEYGYGGEDSRRRVFGCHCVFERVCIGSCDAAPGTFGAQLKASKIQHGRLAVCFVCMVPGALIPCQLFECVQCQKGEKGMMQ